MQIAKRAFIVLIIASGALGDERVEKRRLVSELLEVLDARTLIRQSFESHMEVMSAFFAESGGTAEMTPEFVAFQGHLFARLDYQRYFDEVFVPAFEQRFTTEDLRHVVAFFRSQPGQKLVPLLPRLGIGGAEGVRILDEAAEAAQADLAKEEAAKFPWRSTRNDLRTLATSVEMLATDTNAYPTVAFEALEALLSPTYILEVPKVDAWGTPFLYVSDGQRYRFASAGADRRFEWNTRQLEEFIGEPVLSEDLDADIIFQDGLFVQSPREGAEHRD